MRRYAIELAPIRGSNGKRGGLAGAYYRGKGPEK